MINLMFIYNASFCFFKLGEKSTTDKQLQPAGAFYTTLILNPKSYVNTKNRQNDISFKFIYDSMDR